MLIDRVFHARPVQAFTRDVVTLEFRFQIVCVPEILEEDENFPYEDEIFLVNVGEAGKFSSDKIFQSKFTVFREGDILRCNGYAPDFARRSNVIEGRFVTGETYRVKLMLTKFRVYVEINGGQYKTSYGNGREEITDAAFYARKGVHVDLDVASISFTELENGNWPIGAGVQKILGEGLACNYLFWHNAPDGVYFDRLNIAQNILCTTRNSPAYQTNVELDFYSDTKFFALTFGVSDLPTPEWPLQFGFLLNGARQSVPVRTVKKDRIYEVRFEPPANSPSCNRWTIVFPASASVALRDADFSAGARFAKVEKKETIYFFGDSITEGSECVDPCAAYFNRVTNAYDFYAIDQAVSGRTFSEYTVLGEYKRPADTVMIACGTNSFCGGTAEPAEAFALLDKQMEQVIGAAKRAFPRAKIIALLPVWRSDEAGVRFSLRDTAEKMRQVYERHPEIFVIDCYPFLPHDFSLFSDPNFAIHPNSAGHDLYADRLLQALVPVLGKPAPRRDTERAAEVLRKI